VPKDLSTRIVADLYPHTAVDWRPCFKLRVTSQNSPQLLVSKKFDLATSIGSDLTSIEQLFAYIAEDGHDPMVLTTCLSSPERNKFWSVVVSINLRWAIGIAG
jgi:hypothetical protein